MIAEAASIQGPVDSGSWASTLYPSPRDERMVAGTAPEADDATALRWRAMLAGAVLTYKELDDLLRDMSRTGAVPAFEGFARGQGDDPLFGFENYMSPDWDAEGALAIAARTLSIARELIGELVPVNEAVDAAPGADGSIGLEWWNGESRIFIDIRPNNQIQTYINLGSADEQPREDTFLWGDERLPLHLANLFARLFPQPAFVGGTSSVSSASWHWGGPVFEAASPHSLRIPGYVISRATST